MPMRRGPQAAFPERDEEIRRVHQDEQLYRFHGGQLFYHDPLTGEKQVVSPKAMRNRAQGVTVPLTWEQAAQLDLIAARDGGTRQDVVAALIRERLSGEAVPNVGMPVTEQQFRHDMFATIARASLDARMTALGGVPAAMPDFPFGGTHADKGDWAERDLIEVHEYLKAIATSPPVAFAATGKVVIDPDGNAVPDLKIPIAAMQGMIAANESLRRLRGLDAPKDVLHRVQLSASLDEQIASLELEIRQQAEESAYARLRAEQRGLPGGDIIDADVVGDDDDDGGQRSAAPREQGS